MKKPEPGIRSITFEAALAPQGNCFTLNADGEAKLTIVVPQIAAEPLSQAMAAGWLRDTTFIVTLRTPEGT